MDDTQLIEAVTSARARTLAWLDAMQAPGAPPGVSRISAAHDPERWPGVLLPGTYNAILCRQLLGAEVPDVSAWLRQFRRTDGVFRVPGMTDDTVFKRPEPGETWRYIDFHVTNYALGAALAADPAHMPLLGFVEPFLDEIRLKAWLADRDLRDPWLEGNNIVNLASFLLLLKAAGDTRAAPALDVLLRWHDYHQDPATGFWGVGQSADPTRLLHAMAGSMHNFHIWYALGRALPHQDRAADYVLSRPTTIDSACIDVDLVDLLVHALPVIPARHDEALAWLRRKLSSLVGFQSADGGFADERAGIRRQDGWVRGYEEPQGLSNTFATWFRWIAIAMISDVLWPGRWPWRFRRMIGIGYRREA
jgi:hypothetical protein